MPSSSRQVLDWLEFTAAMLAGVAAGVVIAAAAALIVGGALKIWEII